MAVLNSSAWTPLTDLSVISSVNFSGGTVESYGKLSLSSGVTLGVSNYSVSGRILDIGGANVKINVSAGGGIIFGGQYGTEINLNGVFDSLAETKNYQLISGPGSIRVFSQVSVSGYDKNLFSNVTFDNTGYLTFTAVPEPGAYGIIGACALASVAIGRRRLKK